MSGVRVLVGTRKGAFVLSADGRRDKWDVSGPHFAGWEIYHVKGSPADLPPVPLAVGVQHERALARPHQYPYLTHRHSFPRGRPPRSRPEPAPDPQSYHCTVTL